MDRASELDAFKQLNLSLIASAYGFEIDRKKSTRHSVLMVSGQEKIIIAQNGLHYVYCSVHDPTSRGTVIDFAQRVIEPGCSLGRVRQLLRPFLSSGYLTGIEQRYRGQYQREVRPSEPDLVGLAARYAGFEPITAPHPYLCNVRGIPFEILSSKRLEGRIRHCPRRGATIFPHWSECEAMHAPESCITGYEIKGPGVTMFSRGGRKGLWMSAGFDNDRVLAFAESGLDALSYLAVRGVGDIRVCSLSGQMNPQQPALVRRVISQMEQGLEIVAAFDNDEAGDRLTEQLMESRNTDHWRVPNDRLSWLPQLKRDACRGLDKRMMLTRS